MGNIINITSDDMAAFEANQNSKKAQRTNTFDAKNYLDTHVDEGQESRQTVIRIISIDSEHGSPFSEEVHYHKVRVPKDVAPSGWKSYFCLGKKNGFIDHDKFGSKCPFCEINHVAYDEMTKATDPVLKKQWKDTSLANASRVARICRVIERGKENEGVKFWKINLRPTDNSDAYNQIMQLYRTRAAKGENIFDFYTGRDLIVTFRAGTAAPTVIYDDQCPLSTDESQMAAWVNDPKKWTDVFTPKEYDYLRLIAEMRTPYFVKGKEPGEKGMWVDKAEYEKEKESVNAASNEAIKKAEQQLMYGDEAPVNEATPVAAAPAPEMSNKVSLDEEIDSMFVAPQPEAMAVEGDDLPF